MNDPKQNKKTPKTKENRPSRAPNTTEKSKEITPEMIKKAKRRAAVQELKNDISGIAVSIASKVVEKEISEKDHEKLIQDFIDQMGEAV